MMKRYAVLTAALLLLTCLSAYAATPSNSLIPNGDIENGIWSGGSYAHTNPTRAWATDVSSGTGRALKISGPGYYYGYFQSDFIPVQGGTTYNLSLYIKTEAITRGVSLSVHWYSAGTWHSWLPTLGSSTAGTTPWTRVAGAVTAPAGVTTALIQLRVESDGGSAWLDDIAMVDAAQSSPPPVVTPTTPVSPRGVVEDTTTGRPVDSTSTNPARSSSTATQYRRWETSFSSARTYANPFSDVTLRVLYTGPAGQQLQGYGFWDGGRTFRLRMAFPTAGTWTYATSASDPTDAGLHQQRGTIQVQPPSSTESNPLYRHGPLRVSADRRHLAHADGTPFLWLGDTLWGATVWLSEAGFREAIADRRAKRFTVLQTNVARKAEVDTTGATPWAGDRWDVGFMQKLDRMFNNANDQGMYLFVNGLVDLLWERGIDDYERLITMLAIRYAAHHLSWASSMDDPYDPVHVVINQFVRDVAPHQLLAQHPGSALDGSGNVTTALRYYDLPTVDYAMVATGVEGDLEAASANAIRWTQQLAVQQPPKPVLNGEAWYEGLGGGGAEMTAHLAYLTLLSGGCGYTYGTALWNARDADLPAWKAYQGATYMRYVYDFFVALEQGRPLIPRHDRIVNPAGRFMDRQLFAQTGDGRHAVAYLPQGGAVTVDLRGLGSVPLTARWYNPLTGSYTSATSLVGGSVQTFQSPLGDAMSLLKISRR